MVWPLLRGRSPTRSVAPKRQGGSGVLLSGFSLLFSWRVGAEESGAAEFSSIVYWFRRRRCCSRRSGRLGGERRRFGFIGFRGPALTSFLSLTRARARERGLAVVTGSLAHAIGRAKTAGGLGRASLRLFLGAWVPKNLARRI